MLSKQVVERVQAWVNSSIDNTDKEQLKKMLEQSDPLLEEGFYKDLEFGTGGLRGIMGLGTNFINKYTISIATQGLANYINQVFQGKDNAVAIAHDSRNNSRFFAEVAAQVFAANQIKVYLFDDLRPTPELSFAVRYLKCQAGVVITASHNPPEYNGYKVYWEDGAQVTPPHDKNIIQEVAKVGTYDNVKTQFNSENIIIIGEKIDEEYLKKTISLAYLPTHENKQTKVVYTPLHGTGIKLIPKAFEYCKYSYTVVKEQESPDGNFPTVSSPNPEEASAMELAQKQAEQQNADIFIGTDPDTDRVGAGIKISDGKYMLLNGNQAASLLVYYNLLQRKNKGLLQGNEFVAKTIVTTDLIKKICDDFHVECYETLTGFKYIAELIRKFEGKKKFICGGEESYGYLVGDYVRDKDAVVSALFLTEITEWAKRQNKTLLDVLLDIYEKYGFYYEKLLSITKKGIKGAEEIALMMSRLRENPPQAFGTDKIVKIIDYQSGIVYENGKETGKTGLPKSNVLQFNTQNGTSFTARPSGTEPKIKFYFRIRIPGFSKQQYFEYQDKAEEKVKEIIKELNLKN